MISITLQTRSESPKKKTSSNSLKRSSKKNGYDLNVFRGALYNESGVPLSKKLNADGHD